MAVADARRRRNHAFAHSGAFKLVFGFINRGVCFGQIGQYFVFGNHRQLGLNRCCHGVRAVFAAACQPLAQQIAADVVFADGGQGRGRHRSGFGRHGHRQNFTLGQGTLANARYRRISQGNHLSRFGNGIFAGSHIHRRPIQRYGFQRCADQWLRRAGGHFAGGFGQGNYF